MMKKIFLLEVEENSQTKIIRSYQTWDEAKKEKNLLDEQDRKNFFMFYSRYSIIEINLED